MVYWKQSLVILVVWVSVFIFLAAINNVLANFFTVGPKRCQECHVEETKVWGGTAKFSGYKKIHRNKDAKKFLKAIGDKRMKKSPTCIMCHYTAVQKPFRKKPKIVHGASCEGCHGPASDWLQIHYDYGKGVKRSAESKEHKLTRLKMLDDAGMIRPSELYDVAANCMSCHGLAAPNLPTEIAVKLFSSGHPLKTEFELVEYSQGNLRHRFYPPDQTVNKKMTSVELARLYAVGQAASLVYASEAIKKAGDNAYIAEQKIRIATAIIALTTLQDSLVEAKALLAEPSEENGRKFANALVGQDLTEVFAGMLPKTYR
jgi:hypothetical protein